MELLVVFCSTLIAAGLSSMSGGGTGIINFPAFFALGIPFPLAIAISSLNSAFWVLPASYNYLKGRVVDWKFIALFSAIGLIGTYLSTLLVINLDQRTAEVIIGIIILFLVAYTYFQGDLGLTEKKIYSKTRQTLAYVFAVPLGFYENAFGSGNGIAFSMVTFYTKGFDLIDALGHYYAIAFPWTVFGAALLIMHGYYNIPVMTSAVIGSVIGAYIGSRYARYKGNKFIKILFVAIGGILGLKLLVGL